MRRPLVIYDFATDPFWISLYEENFIFFFVSVAFDGQNCRPLIYVTPVVRGILDGLLGEKPIPGIE